MGEFRKEWGNEIVNNLEKRGEAGERIWKQIIGSTADIKRHMRGSNYPHLYPQTLKEASEYYRLED